MFPRGKNYNFYKPNTMELHETNISIVTYMQRLQGKV